MEAFPCPLLKIQQSDNNRVVVVCLFFFKKKQNKPKRSKKMSLEIPGHERCHSISKERSLKVDIKVVTDLENKRKLKK